MTFQSLIKSSQEQFENGKRERNILDFNDMEHFALDILIQRNVDEKTGEKLYRSNCGR